jgi:hypothetical protein
MKKERMDGAANMAKYLSKKVALQCRYFYSVIFTQMGEWNDLRRAGSVTSIKEFPTLCPPVMAGVRK